MKPTRTAATHTRGCVSSATGANRDMMRSAASHVAARRTRRSNGLRRDTKTHRDNSTDSARGTTTDLIAEASVARTIVAPATNAKTRATATIAAGAYRRPASAPAGAHERRGDGTQRRRPADRGAPRPGSGRPGRRLETRELGA